MSAILGRFDVWHVLLTLTPLVTGSLGALFVWRFPRHLGKMVIVYALISIAVALSPFWLADIAPAATGRRPVLLETKLAFVFGLAFILAAGGRERA